MCFDTHGFLVRCVIHELQEYKPVEDILYVILKKIVIILSL